jgi:hypothetical protein
MFKNFGFTDYVLLDQKICSINNSLETNILAYINPQNVDVEKKIFFEAFKKGEVYNPKFTYATRNPIYSYFAITPSFDTFRRELKELLGSCENDSLSLLFEKRILDLFEKMDLMRSAGTENFTNNSGEYYGTINHSLLSFAKEIVLQKTKNEKKTIDFNLAKKMILEGIKKRGLKHKVVSRETTGSVYAIDVEKRLLYINKDELLSQNSLKRLIAHEIEAHAYRFENGSLQPYKIFAHGVSKENTETEEGLAVKVEELHGINITQQMKDYAGRVVAIDLALKNDFYNTFDELRNYFNDDQAFNLTLRAKRGTCMQEKKGAFMKDILYLRGKMVVEEFLKDHKISDLYMGRYSVYDFPFLQDIDGLKKPKYLPSFLKK